VLPQPAPGTAAPSAPAILSGVTKVRALTAAMGITALLVAAYLWRPAAPVAQTTAAPPRDPCVELNRTVESLHGEKQTQARKLYGLARQGSIQLEGSDATDTTVRETFAAFNEKLEACRLLIIALECTQRRPSAGSSIALKLTDAIDRACSPAAPLALGSQQPIEEQPSKPQKPSPATLAAPATSTTSQAPAPSGKVNSPPSTEPSPKSAPSSPQSTTPQSTTAITHGKKSPAIISSADVTVTYN
jgi:hypothetical protein